jgi:outer membrane protein
MLLLALCAGGSLQAQPGEKIAFTNVELILAYMPETAAIDKQMETMEAKLSQSLEVKQKYYQQKMMDYVEREQKGPAMTETEKNAAVTELQKLEGEIQANVADAQQKLLAKRMELLGPVQAKMQKAIDEVAVEGGYTYILNQAVGSGIPSILYGDKELDVTTTIAKKLGIKIEEE